MNGSGLVGHLMDVGPTPRWDAPLHGMPGQGVYWNITLPAAQQQSPDFYTNPIHGNTSAFLEIKAETGH